MSENNNYDMAYGIKKTHLSTEQTMNCLHKKRFHGCLDAKHFTQVSALALIGALTVASAFAGGLPTGENVVAGQATVTLPTANSMQIDQGMFELS